jgi:hypothetical protein
MATLLHEPKGRPPLRPCPEDFDVIFVEKGREACEAWYRARKTTITRWLIERGKEELISRRAAYVKCLRGQGKWLTRSSRLVETRPRKVASLSVIRDRRKVSILVARHAAQHLRIIRNGGFIVSPTPSGDWWVGSKRLSAAQMVEFAKSKGFVILTTLETGEEREARVTQTMARGGSAEQRKKWLDEWNDRIRAQRPGADLSVGASWVTEDDDVPALQSGAGGKVKR